MYLVLHQEKQNNNCDSTSFVQKLFFRTNYIESNVEKEDIDMKNHSKFKIKLNLIDANETFSMSQVDNNKFLEPSIRRNSARVDFNDKNMDKVRFVIANAYPLVSAQLTQKLYVDESRDEPILMRTKK